MSIYSNNQKIVDTYYVPGQEVPELVKFIF